MTLCQVCETNTATRSILISCGSDTPEGEWFITGEMCDECADDIEDYSDIDTPIAAGGETP